MKVMKRLLATTVAFCAVSSVALAKPCLDAETQAYAHPTLFKSQAQTLVDANSAYVTGGKILKSKNKIMFMLNLGQKMFQTLLKTAK